MQVLKMTTLALSVSLAIMICANRMQVKQASEVVDTRKRLPPLPPILSGLVTAAPAIGSLAAAVAQVAQVVGRIIRTVGRDSGRLFRRRCRCHRRHTMPEEVCVLRAWLLLRVTNCSTVRMVLKCASLMFGLPYLLLGPKSRFVGFLGPDRWNELPAEARLCSSLHFFRKSVLAFLGYPVKRPKACGDCPLKNLIIIK